MTKEELKGKKPLDAVTSKDKFVCKHGPVYLFNGIRYDLRTISEATAEALANDPRCAFIAWKEESKRPEGQRGVYAAKEAPKAAAKPGANAQGDKTPA